MRYPQWINPLHMPSHSSGKSLRVGIVSGFFYDHSNWKIPIKGWVENIDDRKISLYGYYTGKEKDNETEVAKKYFKHFMTSVHSFEDFCRIILEDNLHVLIYPEIGMDSTTLKLASLRLAPVQCASWGHPQTTGLPTIDYYISSDLMEPPNSENHYTEQLIRLPNLSICYTPLKIPDVNVSRNGFGMRPKSVIYLCCQSLFKYLPQYDEIYPRIAQQVGDCQFLFISNRNNLVTETFRSRISRVFSRFNLVAEDYIVFLPQLDPRQYNAINCLSDIYLDSIAWSGCNTTFEAIACNLPVITLSGELMRGRHTAAILSMMGMIENIASSVAEYITVAVRLGKNLEWRKQASDKIAKNKHLVYRDKACIAALENFLEKVVSDRLK